MNIKQYLYLLKGFYKSHKQINTVKSGNQFQFNAKSNIVYPIANIEYITQNTYSTAKVYQFLITIADIFDPNLEASEEDIYSDCNQIADDTLDYFFNQDNGIYTINETATIAPFNNGHNDRVCGCSFLISFSEYRTADTCIIPTTLNIQEYGKI